MEQRHLKGNLKDEEKKDKILLKKFYVKVYVKNLNIFPNLKYMCVCVIRISHITLCVCVCAVSYTHLVQHITNT